MQQRVLVLFQYIEHMTLTTFLREGAGGGKSLVLGVFQLCLQLVNGLHILLALIAESHVDDGKGDDQDEQPYLRA